MTTATMIMMIRSAPAPEIPPMNAGLLVMLLGAAGFSGGGEVSLEFFGCWVDVGVGVGGDTVSVGVKLDMGGCCEDAGAGVGAGVGVGVCCA